MGTTIKPIVHKIQDNTNGLNEFKDYITEKTSENEQRIILQFPTVYIHHWENSKNYEVYIGESNNIVQRTKQHHDQIASTTGWQNNLADNDANLYIIGHEHFNKSLTLDIENRLMLYMMSCDSIKKIHNMRGNPQNKYYPDNEVNDIFHMIWKQLRKDNKKLFPSESAIKDSAVFKASPLHKLTDEQERVKEIIVRRVFDTLEKKERNQIIFIEGEAGTGKTVLNSSAFYELFAETDNSNQEPLNCIMLVNHDEQVRVYSQIADKLGLTERYGKVVDKPTIFINNHTKEEPVDVAFIDEAHLLLTQGKQAYRGKNQLQDIVDRAKVTVVMFDENQVLTTEQYWESQILNEFKSKAKLSYNYFELKDQLRIQASPDVVAWIDNFTKKQKLDQIPSNLGGYELQIFDHPSKLEVALKTKASNKNHKLSRLIATYDWDYNSNASPNSRLSKYWEVMINDWHKPWNRELEKSLSRKEKRAIKQLSWAEQPQTIDEVGSTFTIQGFDLSYAGLILGPSVKYRNGKIVFDPKEKNYSKMTQNRTLSDGSKKQFGEMLIQHEVRVLMTRGVEGLYIYAYDKELRDALLAASKRS